MIDEMEKRIKELYDFETEYHAKGDYVNYKITRQVRIELIHWREKLGYQMDKARRKLRLAQNEAEILELVIIDLKGVLSEMKEKVGE